MSLGRRKSNRQSVFYNFCLLDNPQRLTNFRKGCYCLFQMSLRVSGRQLDPYACLSLRNDRIIKTNYIDSFIQQTGVKIL